MPKSNKMLNVEEVLDGIAFPTGRIEIVDYADDHDASEDAMILLRALPSKTYNNMKDISDNIGHIEVEPGAENTWSSNEEKI